MKQNLKPNTVMLTKESLRRKNFSPDDFFKSPTAKKLKINNETDSQSILVCLMKLADKLQEIRDKIKVKIIINSAYRCKELNEAEGGSKSSFHMQGLAADINADGFTPATLQEWLKASGISTDKCLEERNCLHVQFQLSDAKNRHLFDGAVKINGEWVLTSNLKSTA